MDNIEADKAQFMSIFLSLIDYEKNNNNLYYNHILLDASCSGIQHLSSLFSDIELAKKCNVLTNNIDNDKDVDSIPFDIYT